MNYGQRLKWLIRNQGLSQRDLAGKLHIPESTLSDWTSKEFPPLDAIEAVCGALQIPVSRFFIDYESDAVVEVTALERELLKVFREFTPEQQERILKIIKEIKNL